jgi:hypothetical protein
MPGAARGTGGFEDHDAVSHAGDLANNAAEPFGGRERTEMRNFTPKTETPLPNILQPLPKSKLLDERAAPAKDQSGPDAFIMANAYRMAGL